MKKTFVLINESVRSRASDFILDTARDGDVVEVKEPTRNLEQNARFHAMCGDIAKHGVKWAGKTRAQNQWKVLMVSAHATLTGEGSEIVPGIEGEFVNIRESTAQMSVKRSSSLIDYTRHFGDSQGVEWRQLAEVS